MIKKILSIILLALFFNQNLYAKSDDELSKLTKYFYGYYGDSSDQKYQELRLNAPVIINKFPHIYLYLPNQEDAIIFNMDKYFFDFLTNLSHIIPTIYILKQNFDAGKEDAKENLQSYLTSLQEVKGDIDNYQNISDEAKTLARDVVSRSIDFVQKILAGNPPQNFFDEIRDDNNQLIYYAALENLTQFRSQMELWQKTYSQADWKNSKILIYTMHQNRNLFLNTQFFEWLMKEKAEENSITVAEFTMSPFGSNQEAAQEAAITLLGNVHLDRQIAQDLFDDQYRLQEDILGPAAKEIIDSW